jgi:hypothetical protein
MIEPELGANVPWRVSRRTRKRAILKQAKEIRVLRNRGCVLDALHVGHNAIDLILGWLGDAVLSGADSAEVIDILDASIEFCATFFADEERFIRKYCDALVDAHTMSNQQLLAKFIDARWRASGDGLPLAVLDAVDALNELRERIDKYDRVVAVIAKEQREQAAIGAD